MVNTNQNPLNLENLLDVAGTNFDEAVRLTGPQYRFGEARKTVQQQEIGTPFGAFPVQGTPDERVGKLLTTNSVVAQNWIDSHLVGHWTDYKTANFIPAGRSKDEKAISLISKKGALDYSMGLFGELDPDRISGHDPDKAYFSALKNIQAIGYLSEKGQFGQGDVPLIAATLGLTQANGSVEVDPMLSHSLQRPEANSDLVRGLLGMNGRFQELIQMEILEDAGTRNDMYKRYVTGYEDNRTLRTLKACAMRAGKKTYDATLAKYQAAPRP